MTQFTANSPNISYVTEVLVEVNCDVFENHFADTISDGATREQARRLLVDLLSSALEILMEDGYEAVGADSARYMEAYALLAQMGMDSYTIGGTLRRDAGTLCEENYDRFVRAARERAARSSGRSMTPVERAKASATGSRTTKPRKPKAGSKSVKTRKPSKSVKTKSKASTASKSTKRKPAGRR